MLLSGALASRQSIFARVVIASTRLTSVKAEAVGANAGSSSQSLSFASLSASGGDGATTKRGPHKIHHYSSNWRLNKAASTNLSTASSSSKEFIPHVEPISILQPKHFIPRSQRSDSNTMFPIDKKCSRSTIRKRKDRKDITRILNYSSENWKRHKDVWRHLRHVSSIFTSSAVKRLAFPDLTVNAGIATLLCYYNFIVVDNNPAEVLWMDGASMAGATTAVGLLAGYRVQASYGRYDEARKFWGEINNAARDLAGNAMMWLNSPQDKQRMLRLIQAFPVSVQWTLNDKGGHYEMDKGDEAYGAQLDAEFYAEMLDIYEGDETDEDFRRIVTSFRTGVHVPLGVASWMRQIIAGNAPHAHAIYNREMEEQVSRLVGCLGMCERVLRTPLPPNFTRHTSRLFYLWSNLLPFAMYGSMGLATIPASVMVSWAILGIEDVSVQLEEPFSMLPLRQYSEGMYSGVNDIRDTYLMGMPAVQQSMDSASAMPETNFVNTGVGSSLNVGLRHTEGADDFERK